MNVAIEIPDNIGQQLQLKWHNLPKRTLESLAIEAYRSGVITEVEIQEMLNLSSRWETEVFLKQNQAYLDYTEADLEQDILTIRTVRSQ